MRAPRGRVVLVGLAAVTVFAGGLFATRHGPVGADGDDDAQVTRAAAATSTGRAGLGSLSDRLARLPEVRPGQLDGTLLVHGDDCGSASISFATLRTATTSADVCAEPGAAFGLSANPDGPPGSLQVVDRHGRPTEVIRLPAAPGAVLLTRDGIVFCPRSLETGRLRRFGGGTEPLPGCPVAGGEPLLFAGPGRRSIVDRRGRRVATLRQPLPMNAFVTRIGDGVLAVGTTLYRDGRLLATFDEPGGIVVGASRDGRVAMVGNGTGVGLFLYRNGVAHPLDTALATHAGTVSPDGARLLVQHGGRQLILLDTATLRPLAQFHLTMDAEFLDWLPADG